MRHVSPAVLARDLEKWKRARMEIETDGRIKARTWTPWTPSTHADVPRLSPPSTHILVAHAYVATRSPGAPVPLSSWNLITLVNAVIKMLSVETKILEPTVLPPTRGKHASKIQGGLDYRIRS